MERAESSRNSDLYAPWFSTYGVRNLSPKTEACGLQDRSLQGLPMARNILTISCLETRRNNCHDHQKIDLQSA